MATTYPTFKNNTNVPIPVFRWNLDNVLVPPGYYVVGSVYLNVDAFYGKPYWMEVGLSNVSDGSNPDVSLIVYSYIASSTPAFANNTAAIAGGVSPGKQYYTDTTGEYIVKIAH